MSRAAAEVGSTANSYQILAKLATGGMAEIFLARGEGVAGVERYCVLKRILRDRASDVQFVRMFLDEARLAAQLQHAHIAQVYDIGKLGDSYFFTMEYVHGETVRALLHRALSLGRPLPIHCVLTIALGTAAGLHHAHTRVGFDGRALGIVHRDVSPSNLMVSYEGGVKVVDFGVAKASDRSQETRSGTVKGKIGYLSPEQCKGKRVDRRSDLFSLGICFWEMLTTDRLYRRASDFDNMNAIVTEPTPPPSSLRPDVPREIDELVLRLLAKAPEDRYQTADEVVDAIEGVAVRTGLVLSASALGRLVRELFGNRREPWLEVESHQEPGDAITVTSEPIPSELVIPEGDQVNRQLASVLDLSVHRAVTESLDLSPASEPIPVESASPQPGKRAQLGFPLAAPPPTNPGLVRAPDAAAPEVASVSPGARPAASSSGIPGSSGSSGSSGASKSAGATGASRSPGAAPVPPRPDPQTQSLSSITPLETGNPVVPGVTPASRSGPVPVVPAASRSGPVGVPSGMAPAPRSGPVAAVPSASRSGPASSSQAAMRASASLRMPDRRVPWPLYAVICGAALLGSVAVTIMMRSSAGEPLADVGSATLPPAPAPSSGITVVPIEQVEAAPAGPAPAQVVASAAAPAHPRTVEPARPQ
ncbi:MAG TPA: protein kinase, partial [Kofleriaceae bacterium]|nr:protein kinase [Kofleriaceae bacterium]